MRVLVACEFSGVVREAFRRRGHDAWSCDLLPAEDGSEYHFQLDVEYVLAPNPWDSLGRAANVYQWDLMVCHPPCTHLAVSGARWFKDKRDEQKAALEFVRTLLAAPIHRIALENPVSVISSLVRKPDQIIQPWQFGHPETKATCLWLKNLPLLSPTKNVFAEMQELPARERGRVHHASPGPDRWKERSRTMTGIADAMAAQWGDLGRMAEAAE